ncbi:MAG: hypothetical protein ACRD2G_03660, partial [Terriglobia bacterium]
RLGWGNRAIEVVEDEDDQAPEITAEFYPSHEDGSATGESPNPGNVTTETSANPVASQAGGKVAAAESHNHKRSNTVPIREPQRKAQPRQGDGTSVDSPKPANGTNGGSSQPAAAANPDPTSAANGSQPRLATLRGVVGPLEPEASGNTVRRNGKGVEYVIFTMGHDGSRAKVYCKQPQMMSEIARRQGREAVAQVEVATNGDQPCYILNAFVEG